MIPASGGIDVVATKGALGNAPVMCTETERRVMSTNGWTAEGPLRWTSGCGSMSLLLLEEEPGWTHWCVIVPGIGRLSLEDPEASPPEDPAGKIAEIARTIARSVASSRPGRARPWIPSARFELSLRMLADAEQPGASSQIVVTHPSALSKADILIWPEREGSERVSAGDDLTTEIPARPCRALMRRAGEGSKVLALDAPTTTIMLPALDAVSMLRLVGAASRGQRKM